MENLLLIGLIIFVAAVFGISLYLAKQRREAFQALADEMGFTFSPAKDSHLAMQYNFLNNMDDGSQRYCINVLSGKVDDKQMCVFDYHYETYSTDSEGKRRTTHHWFSIFTLSMPKSFPELVIKREGIFAKLGQAMGFDDIDFESVEFSKRYNVKSKDKKFAYDFCNAQMIAYLLQQEDLIIEVENQYLALTFKGKLAVDKIRPNIDRIQKIHALMPNYLFTD